MSIEDIFTYIVAPALAGIAGVWVVVSKVVLPYYIARSTDVREYKQETESGAFKQILAINETLIQTLISAVDNFAQIEPYISKQFQVLNDILQSSWKGLPRLMSDVRTQLEILNRDRVAHDERLSDIDMQLHEIKAMLQTKVENNDDVGTN